MPEETVKIKKKKLLVVEGHSNNGYSTPTSGIWFATVGKVVEGKRHQITGVCSCREELVRNIFNSIKNTDDGAIKEEYKQADLSALRLLLVAKNTDSTKEKLFSGKRALNIVEDLAGWKKSVITTVNHSTYGKDAWLLTGPAEWMSCPQLISLNTWLIRLSINYGPLKTDDFDALEAHIKEIVDSNTATSNDAKRFGKLFWDKLYIIAKYHKDIFENMDGSAWRNVGTATPNEIGYFGGFESFCNVSDRLSSIGAKQAALRMKKLAEKYLPRKKD